MASVRRPEDYEERLEEPRLREAAVPASLTGPAAAATMAAGFGAFMVGLMTVLAEVSESLADTLAFFPAVGPLSGKVIVAVAVWAVGWIALHLGLRNRNFDLRTAFIVMLVLVALGLIGTFPPFFTLFAAE